LLSQRARIVTTASLVPDSQQYEKLAAAQTSRETALVFIDTVDLAVSQQMSGPLAQLTSTMESLKQEVVGMKEQQKQMKQLMQEQQQQMKEQMKEQQQMKEQFKEIKDDIGAVKDQVAKRETDIARLDSKVTFGFLLVAVVMTIGPASMVPQGVLWQILRSGSKL
jgi:chromosome segregation ATPase